MLINLATRQSRSRCRVDRETVLKINRRGGSQRRHRSCCDFQWPPPNEMHPHVNTNTQHFDSGTLSSSLVADIRYFFDNYERNLSTGYGQQSSDMNMTSSKSTENVKCDQHEMSMNVRNQSVSTPNLCPIVRKCYYLPEEKIHSNKLLEICQHFDVVDDKQYTSGIANVDITETKNQELASKSPQDKPNANESVKEATTDLNRIQSEQQQPLALIKYDNALSCGNRGVDDAFKWKGNASEQLDAFADTTTDALWKDLKAIKSSTEITEMQSKGIEPQLYKQGVDEEERHNSILMNNDCKLHEKWQMYGEQVIEIGGRNCASFLVTVLDFLKVKQVQMEIFKA